MKLLEEGNRINGISVESLEKDLKVDHQAKAG